MLRDYSMAAIVAGDDRVRLSLLERKGMQG